MKNKSLLKNFMYKILLNIFKIGIPLLTIPYIYRLFDSHVMGEIEFAQSIMNYFLIFAGFGVYTYGLREVSKKKNDKIERDKLFSDLFLISLFSSIIILIGYLGFVFFKFNSTILLKNLLLINAINIFSCIFYIEWINEVFENYEFITKKTIFVKIISLLFIFIFLKKETDFYKYLFIVNGTILFNNILSFIHIRKYLTIDLRNLNFKKYLFPLLVIVLINNINILYTNLDKIVLGFYTSSLEVAYYGIGQKVMSVIFMLVMSIITVSIPRLSYYLANDKEKYIILLNKIIEYMSFLIFPMSLGIVGLRKEIAFFFGGNEYLVAASVVGIFGIRMIGMAYESILSNQVIFLYGKEKVIVMILGVCGIINFLLKIILIKGYLGFDLNEKSAILTTILAEILIIIIDYIYITKTLKLKLKIISKNIIYYITISLLFIPIIEVIKRINNSYVFISLWSVVLCLSLYIGLLHLIGENCTLEIKNKILKKFRRL